MKTRDVGVCLVGGMMVYVAMAACSAGGSSSSGTHAGGSGVTHHGGGQGGTPSMGNGGASSSGPGVGQGGDSGIFDAFTDPVPSASAGEPTSGSRLKPKYRVADDGAKEYLSGIWYDTQRNEDCSFATAGDGVERCLPNGLTFNYYSDAGCTMPITAAPTGCSTPTYAVQTATGTCGQDGIHVYALGAPTNPTTAYAKSGSQCFSVGQISAQGYTYYSVGAEVAATSFVAAQTKHD